jgi:hypothetical protein
VQKQDGGTVADLTHRQGDVPVAHLSFTHRRTVAPVTGHC